MESKSEGCGPEFDEDGEWRCVGVVGERWWLRERCGGALFGGFD